MYVFNVLFLSALAALVGSCERQASGNSDSSLHSLSEHWTGPVMEIPDYGYTSNGQKVWSVDNQLRPTLIGGTPVQPGTYKEVVNIRTGNSGCTATVVGPKAAVTAAHCGANGATSTFKIDGKDYSGKITRSSLYPGRDHDIAVIVLTTEVPESVVGKYAHIGGAATQGTELTLLGYGCTQPGGGGGNDGVLRIGKAKVKNFSGFDMVSGDGAALCFGDSGGPAYVMAGETKHLLGVNSKGNIRDTNYNTRTDVPESRSFLQKVATDNNIEICGINAACGGEPQPPPPPPPPPPEGCDSREDQARALLAVAQCLDISVIIPVNQ
jgi:hypothetical protein